MLKVSFDFDGTLNDRKDVYKYCEELLKDDRIEVHITTMRCNKLSDWNKNWFTPSYYEEVYEVADKLGIKRENIHFTNGNEKDWFFKYNKDFIWHLDDDSETCRAVNRCKVIGLCVFGNNTWERKCRKILEQWLLKSQVN